MPTTMLQKGGDAPVAVPAESTGQLHDLFGQQLLILNGNGLIALCGPGVAEHPAGSPLRDTEGLPDMIDTLAAAGRA